MQNTLSYFSTILYRDFQAYTSARLQELGLSYGALPFILYIGKHPGCTPAELTGSLHMDWGHCQRSLDRLAETGFLTKEKEGRIHRLLLTEKGEQAFTCSHQVFHTWDDQAFRALTTDEQQELLHLMGKVTQQFEAKFHV